jgi:hypothetical protein
MGSSFFDRRCACSFRVRGRGAIGGHLVDFLLLSKSRDCSGAKGRDECCIDCTTMLALGERRDKVPLVTVFAYR